VTLICTLGLHRSKKITVPYWMLNLYLLRLRKPLLLVSWVADATLEEDHSREAVLYEEQEGVVQPERKGNSHSK